MAMGMLISDGAGPGLERFATQEEKFRALEEYLFKLQEQLNYLLADGVGGGTVEIWNTMGKEQLTDILKLYGDTMEIVHHDIVHYDIDDGTWTLLAQVLDDAELWLTWVDQQIHPHVDFGTNSGALAGEILDADALTLSAIMTKEE